MRNVCKLAKNLQESRLATVARKVHLRVSIIGDEGAGIASIIERFVYHTDLYFPTSGELCNCVPANSENRRLPLR